MATAANPSPTIMARNNPTPAGLSGLPKFLSFYSSLPCGRGSEDG
jgi:hypothetical protein